MFNTKTIAIGAAAMMFCAAGLAGCGSQPASNQAASNSNQPASNQAATNVNQGDNPSAQSASNQSVSNQSAQPAASQPAQSTQDYIGDQAAIDTALGHAGFAAANVTELKCELDLDDAVIHYDVEFKNGGLEYDYDINAKTGEIISSHSEADD